jgi:TPR repeat protein
MRSRPWHAITIVTWREGVSLAFMACRLCVWLCDRFCPRKPTFWSESRQWEEAYSQEWEPWDETVERRTRAAEAAKLVESDPEAALELFIELADEGSIFAMRWLGTLYHGRHGIVRNLECAEEYFRRGLSAGSWISTLGYAQLLYRRGAHDKWQSTLADGVDKGFIPSFFWQALYTYRLNPSRRVAEEVRPLMLKAAEAGHPGAEAMLAIWTARGKFGLRKIPEGFRMLWATL